MGNDTTHWPCKSKVASPDAEPEKCRSEQQQVPVRVCEKGRVVEGVVCILSSNRRKALGSSFFWLVVEIGSLMSQAEWPASSTLLLFSPGLGYSHQAATLDSFWVWILGIEPRF